MNVLANNLMQQTNKSQLGNAITTWLYKPPKSNKLLLFIAILIIGLIVFLPAIADSMLPWLKKIPSIVFYLLILMIGPLMKYIGGLSKDQEWTLYQNGYGVVHKVKDKQPEERIGLWKDYTSCSYDQKSVYLIPENPLKGRVKIPTLVNAVEIYSICRERISMVRSIQLDKSVHAPQRPNTREQRRLHRHERKGKWGFDEK